ncbi:MAG: DEAD/DEAH box helicase, partial [bacterium]
MRDGKLCRYRLFAAPHRISSKGVKRRSGEFISSEVEGRVVEINGYIVRSWLAANPQRLPTICVAVSVTHAHEVAELYRAAGISAEAVDGKTPKEERRRIFERFRQGRLTVLVACAVVDEGLDVPEATVLQVLRLIGSLRLWRQLIGRVLRPADGKEHAIILDHTDN